MINGQGPAADAAAQDGDHGTTSGQGGDGFGAGGGAGGGAPGYNYYNGGRGADGVVVVVFCPGGARMRQAADGSYSCADCTGKRGCPAPVPPPPRPSCTSSLADFAQLAEDNCPAAPFGRMVPDTCPETCSDTFVPWWEACGPVGELPELDQVPGLHDALTGFDLLCGGDGVADGSYHH